MAKLRINGDSSGYVDLEAPNAASSSTLDLDQVPQKNVANTFTTAQTIQNDNSYWAANIAESSHASVALRVTPTRAGYTKGISLGAIGKNGALSTGIQAYDTSDNSSNTLELNPHGGAVTTPSQPSFTVKKTTAQTGLTASGGSLINWDVALHNIGGHYNLSTKRFTAPVAGRYQFSAGGNIFHYSGTGTYYWLMKKNGAAGQYYGYTQRTDSGNLWIQLVLQNTIIDLNANDYLELFLHASNSSSKLDHSSTNHWSYYSGHLLG